jgi:hypothetical protein
MTMGMNKDGEQLNNSLIIEQISANSLKSPGNCEWQTVSISINYSSFARGLVSTEGRGDGVMSSVLHVVLTDEEMCENNIVKQRDNERM